MAPRDDKERQRRRYLHGTEREREHRENRRNASGSRRDERSDYDRLSTSFDPEDDVDHDAHREHDPMRRRRRRRAPRPAAADTDAAARGTEVAAGGVIARHHLHFVVQRDGRGDRQPLTVRSRPGDQPLVVGDRVSLGIDAADGAFLLLERQPRSTLLERSDPSDNRGQDRLALAANVEVLVLVEPLSRPR